MTVVTRIDRGDYTVYWIVGALMVPPTDETATRHAIAKHPGAFPALSSATALCGAQVKIPTPTPYGDVPRTMSITSRCGECVGIADEHHPDQRKWDF